MMKTQVKINFQTNSIDRYKQALAVKDELVLWHEDASTPDMHVIAHKFMHVNT